MFKHLCAGLALAAFAITGAAAQSTVPTYDDMTFQSGDVTLTGRLWLPEGDGPHPVAILLSGSGRSVRNLDLDPDPMPYHFVERGMAFFAWDKRGVGDSGGEFEALSDTDEVAQLDRLQLLASDAYAAMEFLRARDDIDGERVGVWAFSQGGWVASQLEEVGADPAFIVVVGGPAVTIGEELAYSDIARSAREASRAYEGRVRMENLYAELELARAEAGEFGGYDPLPYIAELETPTIFFLGEYDLSVPTRRSVARLSEVGRAHHWIDHRVFQGASHGLAVRDPAGTMYLSEDFLATQFEYLANLGMIDRQFRFVLTQ